MSVNANDNCGTLATSVHSACSHPKPGRQTHPELLVAFCSGYEPLGQATVELTHWLEELEPSMLVSGKGQDMQASLQQQ